MGGGVQSIALHTPDIHATAEHFDTLGVQRTPVYSQVSSDLPAGYVFGYLFSHPSSTDGVVVEYEAAPPGSTRGNNPRVGRGERMSRREPLVTATALYEGALVADPPGAAARFAALFDTAFTYGEPGEAPGSPAATVGLPDNVFPLYQLGAGDSEALWGRKYERARTHLLGVVVPDVADAAERLAGDGIGIVRRDAHTVVLDPAFTGGATIQLVDSMPPGGSPLPS
jgi:hypothetical protein